MIFIQVSRIERIHGSGHPAQIQPAGVVWKGILIISSIQIERDAPLPESVRTLNLHCLIFGAAQCGQKHRREDRDDCDDNEQFDEREGFRLIAFWAHVKMAESRMTFLLAAPAIEKQPSRCVQPNFVTLIRGQQNKRRNRFAKLRVMR